MPSRGMKMAHPRKVCNCCNQNRRYEFFPRANGRRRDTCKECYAGKQRDRSQCVKNRRIQRLINWGMGALVIIIGTYTHDYVSGASRICFYTTVYGERAVTLSAVQVCPLTWEWEE